MSERVHENEEVKRKIGLDVNGGVAHSSPTPRVVDGRYVQNISTPNGERWVKLAEEDEAPDGIECDALNAPSPLTSVGTGYRIINPPLDAKVCYLHATKAIRYGDNSKLDGTSGNGYMFEAADTTTPPIPCADGAPIYVRADSTSCTVYFIFHDKE